ncbi:MAG: hypothetical protein ABSG53_19110, partial [Thermoguttaceae bacterium]
MIVMLIDISPASSLGPRGGKLALNNLRTWSFVMFRNTRLLTVAVPLIALAAIVALNCPRAEAQVEPFKITGGGTLPQGFSVIGADSPHNATGTATHLGKYSGDGVGNLLTLDPSTLTGTF